MTLQEIFDTVSAHLLTQKTRALGPGGGCAYRSDEGTKCAVGCLIPDELYDPDLEGIGAWRLFNRDSDYVIDHEKRSLIPVMEKLRALINPHDRRDVRCLLSDLQEVHDEGDVTDWSTKLANVAATYNLDTKSLNNFVTE